LNANPGRFLSLVRLSTTGQHIENQCCEIESGMLLYDSRAHRRRAIDDSITAFGCLGLAKLMDRMEEGGLLFVAKLGRVGRNAMDVHATVERLAASGVRAHWFARVVSY
jgi:putative DNA-invertase from lambdoid prophage Rac